MRSKVQLPLNCSPHLILLIKTPYVPESTELHEKTNSLNKSMKYEREMTRSQNMVQHKFTMFNEETESLGGDQT